ncbi:MAG: hypothetical protein ACRC1T_08890 [Clostridium chrysemydis]|uniref:hypothetical protein n=1 Tax=Clostridium chrysemydis TaxID=2665504 RepID=UPI003F2BDCC1
MKIRGYILDTGKMFYDDLKIQKTEYKYNYINDKECDLNKRIEEVKDFLDNLYSKLPLEINRCDLFMNYLGMPMDLTNRYIMAESEEEREDILDIAKALNKSFGDMKLFSDWED